MKTIEKATFAIAIVVICALGVWAVFDRNDLRSQIAELDVRVELEESNVNILQDDRTRLFEQTLDLQRQIDDLYAVNTAQDMRTTELEGQVTGLTEIVDRMGLQQLKLKVDYENFVELTYGEFVDCVAGHRHVNQSQNLLYTKGPVGFDLDSKPLADCFPA